MAEGMDVDSDKPKVVKRPANSGGDASTQPWVSFRLASLAASSSLVAWCNMNAAIANEPLSDPLSSFPLSHTRANCQVEKYRPQKLEELVAHEDIISILTRLIDNDNLPHLLLYGPPGTGKVSPQSLARGTRHKDKIA